MSDALRTSNTEHVIKRLLTSWRNEQPTGITEVFLAALGPEGQSGFQCELGFGNGTTRSFQANTVELAVLAAYGWALLNYPVRPCERLFSVREVVVKGDPTGRTAFGIRHKDGGWWNVRYATRTEAEWMLDAVLLLWLETGGGLLLVDGFHECVDA